MQITKGENGCSLTLEGALDISGAEELRQALCDLLDGSSSAVVELSALGDCDTAVLQLLLAARRTAVRLNKTLRFASWGGAVADVSTAIGLNAAELTSLGAVDGGSNGGV
ncbi:MAG TPA: STAS domain-containing protein [Bryobacteraceae bacterium]|nr:STAS domain-containing protein [Bryobacteraceae bacterium]